MTDQLSIYNGALSYVGERKLATLTENREPRHILDDIWNRGGIDRCLQQGFWRFATRTVEILADEAITPDFGFEHAFKKPDDFIRLVYMSDDEYQSRPLIGYRDEGGYWWWNSEPLYASYVSNDSLFGMDFSLWPPNFTAFVELWFAEQLNPRLTHTQTKQDDLRRELRRAKIEARNTDAMDDSSKQLPEGSWSRSRNDGRSRDDRGPTSRLLG